MNPNIHPFYRHSGKFNPAGPILVFLAALVAAFPLGLLYSYLINWIPFIYLNFLITLGYGFVFGTLTSLLLLKFGKVRNTAVAFLSGTAAGLIAWYFSWNGHIHALAGDVPWLLTPGQIWTAVKILYNEGSWGIGFGSQEPLTGIPLAIVWLGEGAMIVGLAAMISYRSVKDTPFCEQHNCWFDEKKVIDKFDVFTHPQHLEAFKTGDIAPLEEARPRVPASGQFARVTVKHSKNCHDLCTLSIDNVTVTPDKNGNPKEKASTLVTHLLVPKSMIEYLDGLGHAAAKA